MRSDSLSSFFCFILQSSAAASGGSSPGDRRESGGGGRGQPVRRNPTGRPPLPPTAASFASTSSTSRSRSRSPPAPPSPTSSPSFRGSAGSSSSQGEGPSGGGGGDEEMRLPFGPTFRAPIPSIDTTVLRLGRGTLYIRGAMRTFGDADAQIRMMRRQRAALTGAGAPGRGGAGERDEGDDGDGRGGGPPLPRRPSLRDRLALMRRINELAVERGDAGRALETFMITQGRDLVRLQDALDTRDLPEEVRRAAYREGVRAADYMHRARDRIERSRQTDRRV
ncbi:hypothetical protein CSUI_007922 [Cystoisospora suis]|uniref:Uncharacterized protein n=1 Tax=Cystoisospora suis TaxID=483139 RepID=A0A2C6KBP8_9APIC|nr:hypothetical protein CSUI_007922 [Cystoisospora suis]